MRRGDLSVEIQLYLELMKELESLTFLCLINFRLNSKDIIK